MTIEEACNLLGIPVEDAMAMAYIDFMGFVWLGLDPDLELVFVKRKP